MADNIHIDEGTIKKTTKCNKEFRCLSDTDHLCKVEYCVGKSVHFVECKSVEHCYYKMNFGKTVICNCPVRKEIYSKYAI